MIRLLTGLMLAILPTLASAEEHTDSWFVEANILGIFYHELGHAVIDIEGVPIFGQEEDAADVFSIFLIDALFEEETAEALAFDAALGFWAEADLRQAMTDEIEWWAVHGQDEQRFYNTVCIFYGADPDTRESFAADLGLPEERAEYCPEEYDMAAESWGLVLDDLFDRGPGATLIFEGDDGSLAASLIAEEVALLNEELSLAEDLFVVIESCDEANAFYDPNVPEIVFCTEFEEHLISLERRL